MSTVSESLSMRIEVEIKKLASDSPAEYDAIIKAARELKGAGSRAHRSGVSREGSGASSGGAGARAADAAQAEEGEGLSRMRQRFA